MGRAAAVLRRRAGAAAVLLAALFAYYAFRRELPNVPTGWDVVFIAAVLIPAVFALMWLALPLRERRGLLPVALAFAALAYVTSEAGLDVLANFAKLGAAIAVAFWFLGYFESALWVALVALMIPFVDAFSVWRGPTRHILDERPEVFTALSFSFPLIGERQAFLAWQSPLGGGDVTYVVTRTPGGVRTDEPLRAENGEATFLEAELDADRDYEYEVIAVGNGERAASTVVSRADDVNEGFRRGTTPSARAPADLRVDSVDSSAKLGLPDLLFFALFLAAADRFRLRTRLTWLLMAASFGLTLLATYVFLVDGLPALPLLALAFLVANADLLWRQFRARRD